MDKIKEILKRYLSNFFYFYQRLGYKIFVSMGLSIGIGFFDGIGLAMFLPLLQVASSGDNTAIHENRSMEIIVKGMHSLGMSLTIVNVILVLCSFFILKGCAQYIKSIFDIKLRRSFFLDMRLRMLNAFSQISYRAFVGTNIGQVQNTLTGEINKVGMAYEFYFYTIQQMVLVFVYALFAFFVDFKFALLICIGGVGLNFFYKLFYSITKEASYSHTKVSNTYQGLIIQYVNNFKYLKATGLLEKMNKKLSAVIYKIEDLSFKAGKISAIVSATREPLTIIIICLVILFQLQIMHGNIGSILVSLLFFYRALGALMQMQNSVNSFLANSGSLRNMQEFEIHLNENREEQPNTNKFIGIKKHIKLVNATFKYGDNIVLDKINLELSKNQTIALVGESGGGKTTLVNIIVGLLPLNSGVLLLDDHDVQELNIIGYQRQIGYITQEPVIFNDSIYNNVTFWDEWTEENKMRFEKAVHEAAIDNFVESLPEKEHTMLGANGVNLSGGQKQRISIARELYKKINLLVLDEATSALDSVTEREIQNNIDALRGKYTVIVVAHRLSTIKNADCIFFLEKGRVTAKGTFDELLRTSEKFRRLVALQEV